MHAIFIVHVRVICYSAMPLSICIVWEHFPGRKRVLWVVIVYRHVMHLAIRGNVLANNSSRQLVLNLTHLPWTQWPPFLRRHFRCIFLNEKVRILIRISLKYVLKGPIDNNSALVWIMVRGRWALVAAVGLYAWVKFSVMTRGRFQYKYALFSSERTSRPSNKTVPRPSSLYWKGHLFLRVVVWWLIANQCWQMLHVLYPRATHHVVKADRGDHNLR